MPLTGASTRNPAAKASDTRFEIVMVKRSLAAANAIRAGNSISRAMSRIMGYTARAVDAGAERPAFLSVRCEQAENGTMVHQMLAIRKAITNIANTSARHNSSS